MDCPRQINITCFGANVFEEFGMRRKVYGYSKSRNLGPNNIDPIAEPSWVRQPELALDCHEEALRRTPYVRCAECHYYWLWRSIDLFTGGWNDSSDGRAQQHRQGDARAFRDTLIAANNVLPGI
ncbi:MAG: hypothetical protein M4579_001896 [Chaenotheca gracillima]|nr:MAG: hypothetical protein M4579_001896 [Chaenotheca gracillima]